MVRRKMRVCVPSPVFSQLHSGRRPWFNRFRATLGRCASIDEIATLLRVKVQRWRGLPPLDEDNDSENVGSEDEPQSERITSCKESGNLDDQFAAMSLLR